MKILAAEIVGLLIPSPIKRIMFFAKFVFSEVSSKARESLSSWKPRCLQNISSEKITLGLFLGNNFRVIHYYHERNTTLLPSVVNVEGMFAGPDR